MRNLFFIVAGAMFLFVSCQSDDLPIYEAAKPDNANVIKTRTIEFKSYKGEIFAPPVIDDFLQIGGGTATHLGKYTFENTATFPDFNGSFYGVMTTAVGDQIFYDSPEIVCDENVIWPEPNFCPGINTTFTYTIIGGTGRFENATGTMTFEGLFVPLGEFDATGTAEITYNVNVIPE